MRLLSSKKIVALLVFLGVLLSGCDIKKSDSTPTETKATTAVATPVAPKATAEKSTPVVTKTVAEKVAPVAKKAEKVAEKVEKKVEEVKTEVATSKPIKNAKKAVVKKKKTSQKKWDKKPVVAHFVCYYDESIQRLPNPNYMTHIIFGLARINKDFSLSIPTEKMLSKVAALKKDNPDVKITMLVGGVRSANFSEACRTKQTRAKLLSSFGKYMRKYNLDGIDLDWEFPTKVDPATGQNGIPEDVQNYTLLMRDFKRRFPDKILTVDVGNTVEHIDFTECAKYVDYFNLMTYDYSLRSHSAPLFPSPMKNNNCVSMGVEKLMSLVPSEKILMGIPFYGILTSEKYKNQPQIAYSGIASRAKADNLTLFRNEIARASCYMDSDMKIALSFDDEQTVREKCRYARDKKLGGVMVWQYLYDDNAHTLSNAIADECDVDTAKNVTK